MGVTWYDDAQHSSFAAPAVDLRHAPAGAESLPLLRIGTANARNAGRARPRLEPRRRERTRLPRAESFYAADVAQGLSRIKEELGERRKDRRARDRSASQPALADPAVVAAIARRRRDERRPESRLEEVAGAFDRERFANRELLESFGSGRPLSPPTFRRQVKAALGHTLTGREVAGLYNVFDEDGSGTIDGDEFSQAFRRCALDARDKREARDLRRRREKEARHRAQQLKTLKALKPAFAGAPADDEVEKAFLLFDADGSGTVSGAEVRKIESMLGEAPTPETREMVDAAEALDDVRVVVLEACEKRHLGGRELADFFRGELGVAEFYGQALGAKLDARLLAALAAALGGFVPGRGTQKLVEGRNFSALVGRWTAEHGQRAERRLGGRIC